MATFQSQIKPPNKEVMKTTYLCLRIEKAEHASQMEGLINQTNREISVMHLFRHPNVVEQKKMMATKLMIFFIMEYVCGFSM